MSIVDLVGKLPVHSTLKYGERPLDAIRRLVLHHTAGPTTQTPEEIARFHVETRDWPGIAYHYLVGPDGTAYKCWPTATVTYCVKGGNTSSLCVCLIGDFTTAAPPIVQWQAAVSLAAELMHAYHIDKLYGHREVPTNPPQTTECPGKMTDMALFREAVAEVLT